MHSHLYARCKTTKSTENNWRDKENATNERQRGKFFYCFHFGYVLRTVQLLIVCNCATLYCVYIVYVEPCKVNSRIKMTTCSFHVVVTLFIGIIVATLSSSCWFTMRSRVPSLSRRPLSSSSGAWLPKVRTNISSRLCFIWAIIAIRFRVQQRFSFFFIALRFGIFGKLHLSSHNITCTTLLTNELAHLTCIRMLLETDFMRRFLAVFSRSSASDEKDVRTQTHVQILYCFVQEPKIVVLCKLCVNVTAPSNVFQIEKTNVVSRNDGEETAASKSKIVWSPALDARPMQTRFGGNRNFVVM